ncbi:hypothetical protein ABS735_28305 [Streptomyces sp. MMCC 100]|uniref:hypothetical protein n=1 Tax=Streptomyces sp. MMCC 100 TaxID=3163555 RepID=UPI003595B6DC
MTEWLAGMRITADRLADDLPGDWQDVTFNQWTQGDQSYAPLRAQRHGRRARLDGHARPSASFTGSQIAFTVPAELTPTYQIYVDVPRITAGSPSLIGAFVAPNGEVTVYTSTSIGTSDRYWFGAVEWALD